MHNKTKLMWISILLLLAACKQQQADTSAAAQTTQQAPLPIAQADGNQPQAVAPVQDAKTALEAKFSKAMAYNDLREATIGAGWLPLKDVNCAENVGGEATVCKQRPETESCSGDGHCNFWFANSDSGMKLRVGTYGDEVKSWEFSEMTVQAPASCPSENFEEFLKKFASDSALQKAHTAAFVKVGFLADNGDQGYSDYQAYVSKESYQDFQLTHQQDGYHAIFNGQAGPKSLPVEIKQESPDAYLVAFKYGVSEGNSYRFKRIAGCWQLVEDPDAPSP